MRISGSTVYTGNRILKSRRKGALIIIIFLTIVLAGLECIYAFRSIQNFNVIKTLYSKLNIHTNSRSEETGNTPGSKTPDTVIAIVGKEKIYQRDLDTELRYFPKVDTAGGVDVRTYLLNKIIEDSILLQENAKKENLSSDVFNNPDKDYLKRTAITTEIKTEKERSFDTALDSISGEFITMWVRNITIGPLGLVRSREIVQKKINQLQQQVALGQITIYQAGEQIKQDTGLAQIDSNYQGNAITHFTLKKGDSSIIGNLDFTSTLWNISKGSVTKVFYLGADTEEEYYIFGQVTDRVGGENTQTYQDWLQQKMKEYNVQKQ